LGPDLDFVAQASGGFGDFLGERRDPSAHGIKLMSNEINGRNGVGRDVHAVIIGSRSAVKAARRIEGVRFLS
jgi:hypothetical protein